MLHTRLTGIPKGRYDVSLKVSRYLGVSLDGGETWVRYERSGTPIARGAAIEDGVFELWVDDRYAYPKPGPCYYDQVILTPCATATNGITNPRFNEVAELGGKPLGWDVRGCTVEHNGDHVSFVTTGSTSGRATHLKSHAFRVFQDTALPSGHYLLTAMARSDCQEVSVFASTLGYVGEGDRCQRLTGPFGVPVGVSEEFREIVLPFFVEADGEGPRQVTLGVRSHYGIFRQMRLDIRELRLERLGDTRLKRGWAADIPMKRWHGLETVREHAQWKRPGRVAFSESNTGAEVWLVTQGEKAYLRAQGLHAYSPRGKYLYVKDPGALLRSDGTRRWVTRWKTPEPWLYPWMRRRLPPESGDPEDWILAGAPTGKAVKMRNIVTGATHEIPMPTKSGWTLRLTPAKVSGVRLDEVQHETFAWLSEDEKRIGLSDPHGESFRAFDVQTLSADSSKDVWFWPNRLGWRRGFDGRWYVFYGLNWVAYMGCNPYYQSDDNTVNPGQIWAIPEDATRQDQMIHALDGMAFWAMSMRPYHMNDGSMLHSWTATHRAMNTQAGWRLRGSGYSSLYLEDPATAQVKHHIGTYPVLDHVDFSDAEVCFPESLLYPYTLLAIDVKRRSWWRLAALQFQNYGTYTAGGGAGLQAQAPSPDATKVACVSSMLCRTEITHGQRPRKNLDVYSIVSRYPSPPIDVRRRWGKLTWDPPRRHTEVLGYNVYRAGNSGGPFTRLNEVPVPVTEWTLPEKGGDGVYALTSVEHSRLESRRFSTEVAVGRKRGAFRHFYEAEQAEMALPMVLVFEPGNCSDAFAVAVRDQDLLYRKRLREGLRGSGALVLRIPRRSRVRLFARCRSLRPDCSGQLHFRLNRADTTSVLVSDMTWRWLPITVEPVRLRKGNVTLVFGTSDVDVAIDAVAVTDDPEFLPTGRGNVPEALEGMPANLCEAPLEASDEAAAGELMQAQTPHTKLVWDDLQATQGVAYYSVYRSETPEFAATVEALLGSPVLPVFYDCGLTPGTSYHYRVRGVDAWGNQSLASAVLTVQAQSPTLSAAFVVEPGFGIGGSTTMAFDGARSRAKQGTITSWHWDFGDGATANVARASHTFADDGTYGVKLKVGSDCGEWATCEQSIHVWPAWLRGLGDTPAALIEAETFTEEGGGTSKTLDNRENASGQAVSYWHKDIGHWLEWKAEIVKTGSYGIVLKYATASPEATRDCRIDGDFPSAAWERAVLPTTGGWSSTVDNWSWSLLKDSQGAPLQAELTKGQHVLRMSNLGGGLAVDCILIVPVEEFSAVPKQ
ncbi:MAG: PKD domain-containing protein [Lentisphaerae bacterium]|nr:PKD domain-containing protein [Lentisphaerota bacterium]